MAVRSITLSITDRATAQNPQGVQEFVARGAGRLLTDILIADGIDSRQPLWVIPEIYPFDNQTMMSMVTLTIKYTPYTTPILMPVIDSRHERFPASKKLNAGKKSLGPSHSSDSIEA